MCGINFVGTEYSSGSDHPYGKSSLLHLVDLASRGLCSEKHLAAYVEGILLILGGMICRNVKCLEIVIVLLDLGTFNNFITHTDEHSLDLIKSDLDGMTVSGNIHIPGKCNIYGL